MAGKHEGPLHPDEALLHASVRHDVFLLRHATHNRNEVLAFLNDEMIPDLEDRILGRLQRIANATERGETFRGAATIARLKDLRDALDDQVSQGIAQITEAQKSALTDLGVAETSWAAAALKKAIPVPVLKLLPDVSFTTLPLDVVSKIVRTQPMQGKLLKDTWADLGAGFQAEVERQVKLGMTAGETMDQITARVFGRRMGGVTEATVDKLRREASTIARTSVMDVSNTVRHETFAENDDVVAAEKWVATLDTRTCPACGALDGEEWEVDDAHPRPPLHFACRCSLVPITRLDRELEKAGLLDDLPPSTRAAMSGPVSETLTYPEWLGRQSASMQDEVLGPGRAALYRKGKLEFEQFSDEQGRPLTLAQLLRLEASLN